MSTAIIHISDLHVTTYRGNDGKLNTSINSYLTTEDDTSKSDHFIKTFIDKVQNEFQDNEYILIISGDISDRGEIKEFEFASKFVHAIIAELDIPSDRLVIIPGDHDVHRRSLQNALDEEPNSKSYLLNEAKFKHFSNFYFDVKGSAFPFEKIIIEHTIVEEKIVLLAINSNYKIDTTGGDGYIPIPQLNEELNQIKTQIGEGDFQYIACWHHNITAGYENKNSGQWEEENRKHLLAELDRQNIKLVLTGNEHISDSKSLFSGAILTSDAGAFTAEKSEASFKVYGVECSDTKIALTNVIYTLQKPSGNDIPYAWDIRTNTVFRQDREFVLFEKNEQVIEEALDIPHQEGESQNLPEVENNPTIEPNQRKFYHNPVISDKLYKLIKEKGLYQSGHFHWSETSRAHNWIDVSKLLEDNNTLSFVQNAIIDIIDEFNLSEESDLIIGLGYEGNIIASKAAIKYNIPYTSLPYSYRYNDHHDYEKKLNYDNSEEKYKTVIIVTDVVNDGRTIRKLIDKREKNFFSSVERVIVLSLFYTGHSHINTDILNFNKLPENYDFENDHEVNNIEYYTVKSLRVEKCPFGKNYKEECLIYKDGLGYVHLFYAEEEIS